MESPPVSEKPRKTKKPPKPSFAFNRSGLSEESVFNDETRELVRNEIARQKVAVQADLDAFFTPIQERVGREDVYQKDLESDEKRALKALLARKWWDDLGGDSTGVETFCLNLTSGKGIFVSHAKSGLPVEARENAVAVSRTEGLRQVIAMAVANAMEKIVAVDIALASVNPLNGEHLIEKEVDVITREGVIRMSKTFEISAAMIEGAKNRVYRMAGLAEQTVIEDGSKDVRGLTLDVLARVLSKADDLGWSAEEKQRYSETGQEPEDKKGITIDVEYERAGKL
jgi:hypothetical protein